ncbi:MAG: hypothetical protein H7A51_17255 [Akkermansiaceae bacterium]|nr:hypothetical protein [Akkermansiaceae bacterium]
MRAILTCMIVWFSALEVSVAEIAIAGGRMMNPGSWPYMKNESVAGFIDRIGGIEPSVYSVEGEPFLYPITSLRISNKKGVSQQYSIKRDASKLWKRKLEDGDIIRLLTVSLFESDEYPRWKGKRPANWRIRIQKAQQVEAPNPGDS